MSNKLEDELGLRELTPYEVFMNNPKEFCFRRIPKAEQTYELALYAVQHDGNSIKSVSRKLIDEYLCEQAILQEPSSFYYIPDKYKTKRLCEFALDVDGSLIAYIDTDYITADLAVKAINNCTGKHYKYPIGYVPKVLITKDLVKMSVTNNPESLRDIPKRFITKELINIAINGEPLTLEFVPAHKRTKDICMMAYKNNKSAIEWIPEEYVTEEMYKDAFEENYKVIKVIPQRLITRQMCITAINKFNSDLFSSDYSYKRSVLLEEGVSILNNIPNILFSDMGILVKIPYEILNHRGFTEGILNKLSEESRNYIEKKIEAYNTAVNDRMTSHRSLYLSNQSSLSITPLESGFSDGLASEAKLSITPVESVIPDISDNEAVSVNKSKNEIRLLEETNYLNEKVIYYISDLHLEHQLSAMNISSTYSEISSAIDLKLDEMCENVDTSNMLLIGGDVSYSIELSELFYQRLSEKWKGRIISILGNHELWDGNPVSDISFNGRNVEEIVQDYIISGRNNHITYLHNSILITYKGCGSRIITEQQINTSLCENLKELCEKSSLIILGGTGFSGYNPVYNADKGIYRSTIKTIQEDREETEKFRRIHDKLIRCAGHLKVIVLTHNPMSDWSHEQYNPNWIYINGHTHNNNAIIEKNGPTVLFDNQIGYKPQKWSLKGFTLSGWYDPFKYYEDGIHKITLQDYLDFNRGMGIECEGCNCPGQIYALKRSGTYLFLLKSTRSLCLLNGGGRRKMDNTDIDYYYNNMEEYGRKVKTAISPYYNTLQAIAKEVKSFGGEGRVHGCIIDISFYSHIHIDPRFGDITIYWALDMLARLKYDDIESLLADKEPDLSKKYLEAKNKGKLPLLEKYILSNKEQKGTPMLPTIPKIVMDQNMYDTSNIMRKIQYVFDQNVIRIWNEEVLKTDFIELENHAVKKIK